MIRMEIAAALAFALTTPFAVAQITPGSSAGTLVTPYAADPSRAGQTVQLPQGGQGVTTGGTPFYQSVITPGGGAIMVPNGGATSTVIGPGVRSGTVVTPH
jgi:hypothetical protein